MGLEIQRWDRLLPPEDHAVVEKRRSRYVKGYDQLKEQGFKVIGEVVPPSGRLLRRGRRALVTMIQEIVAQEEIQKLKDALSSQHQKVEFEWAEGAVVPYRRTKFHAYTMGVTVFVRQEVPKIMAVAVPFAEVLEMALV